MGFQSPYRGDDSSVSFLSPRVKEWISRGTMVVIGLTLIYFSTRGLIRLYGIFTTTPVPLVITSNISHRTNINVFPWLIWLSVITVDLIGVATVIAALLPVGTMQALFERFNQPPITGDRGMSDNDWRPWWLRW